MHCIFENFGGIKMRKTIQINNFYEIYAICYLPVHLPTSETPAPTGISDPLYNMTLKQINEWINKRQQRRRNSLKNSVVRIFVK